MSQQGPADAVSREAVGPVARFGDPDAGPLELGGQARTVSYGPDGLVPVVCQDAATGRVLMLAWTDAEGLAQTLQTRQVTLWSRSRGQRWVKGATSGNTMDVVWAATDCDGDALLLGVVPAGPACHTGAPSCFGTAGPLVDRLSDLLVGRREADPVSSYTARLLNAPREEPARKVGEEAVEVLLAAPGSRDLVGEVADLWYHAMVLLTYDGVDPREVLRLLLARHLA